MNIYKIETAEAMFLVIAKNKNQAKKIVIHDYFDDDDEIKIGDSDIETSEIQEGILLHYDYEDIYFNKLTKKD